MSFDKEGDETIIEKPDAKSGKFVTINPNDPDIVNGIVTNVVMPQDPLADHINMGEERVLPPVNRQVGEKPPPQLSSSTEIKK